MTRSFPQPEWGRALAKLMAANTTYRTQGTLAKRSGVAQSTIGRILRGEADPRISTLTFLAGALRISMKTFAALAYSETSGDQPGMVYAPEPFEYRPAYYYGGVVLTMGNAYKTVDEFTAALAAEQAERTRIGLQPYTHTAIVFELVRS